MPLLERAPCLQTLHDAYADVVAGHGRLVFVGGEMGIGKTALVEEFGRDLNGRSTVLTVSCDGLALPGPLGPLFDIAHALGSDAELLVTPGVSRADIFRAVERVILDAPRRIVLVAEDAHWADDASIDLLRFLGSRIERLPLLLIVTWRSDELAPGHPLRRTIGDLVGLPSSRRLELDPFSLEAVQALAHDRPFDGTDLYRYTGGNPFFVTEILATGSNVPISITDAILGRASRLHQPHRRILDTAALLGEHVDLDVLELVAGEPVSGAISESLTAGLLRSRDRQVEFRHAAVRSILIDDISPIRSRDLHRLILAALLQHSAAARDYARLAWHAEAAGDRPAVVVHATAAAREAAAFRSHRQAAEQYARVLRFADDLAAEELADLLEAQAYECYLAGRIEDALAAQRRASTIRSEGGDPRQVGNALRRLSLYCWYAGDGPEANHHAAQALAMLERFPPSSELVMACSHLAAMRALASDQVAASALADRALTLARDLDDRPALVHALITLGAHRLEWNEPGGRRLLDEALALARRADLHAAVGRAMENLAWIGVVQRDAELAGRYLEEGLAHAAEYDLITVELLLHAHQATWLVMDGDWEAASREASIVLRHTTAPAAARVIALIAGGLARLRSGERVGDAFDRALQMATRLDEAQYVAMARAGRCEVAWLRGDLARCASEARAGEELALRTRNPWLAGELARWLARAGEPVTSVQGLPAIYACEIEGDLPAAREMWLRQGLEFEAARVQSLAPGADDMLAALAVFDRLGTRLDMARVARALRQQGVTRIPRGQLASTRSTFGNLTRRELDVLALMAEGRTNAEIAHQLYVSPKTAAKHVSSILAKLEASTRTEAVAAARRAGLLRE